jgi:flagellar basal body rod protein FlgC
MYDQSITGIRTNLEAFNQAASRIANPYETQMPRDGQGGQKSRGTGPGLQVADEKSRDASQNAEQVARAQSTYQSAVAQPSTSTRDVKQAEEESKATDANAPKETANEPGTRSQGTQAVDQSRETAKMMIAAKGVEANLGALKTAQSLSGQTVDILA